MQSVPINPAWEVHPVQVKEALDQAEPMLLLDVRRLDEWNKSKLPGATLVPLQELQARIGELDSHKAKRIIVYCHHGARSLHATAFLRHQGFTNAHSMAGGIDAYSLLSDPAIPRY